MEGSEARESRGLMYARTLQSVLRQYGALDFSTLLSRSGLDDEKKVRAGLRFSRRNKDNEALLNEIIAVVNDASGTPVYFLAANDEEAESYENRRKAIALGHIQSVIYLEEKRYEKWPSPQRAAAIKMLEMAYNLLSTSA